MYYSSVLGVDLGMFYKRRDYSQIINGRNPIVAHEYLGSPVEGKTVFITDDIIASGESMLDIAYALRRKNVKNIYCYGTYATFTHGFDKFDEAYNNGIINGVLGTNLTYCPEELLGREWFRQVDVSKYISYFIDSMNHDVSVNSIINPHEKIKNLLENRK
jgi:ribose-phosphate pyrophosphokinase